MLEDLRGYENLGTVGYYWELLSLFYNFPDVDWDEVLKPALREELWMGMTFLTDAYH